MSEMEQDIKVFFKKLAVSVYTGVFWVFAVMTFGIYFRLMFIEDKISVGNIIFYLLVVFSFVFLARFYLKLWKEKPHKK
ncbi:MAG: hypothetical protein JST47_14220 [Bacteroidetes bacterium]|nr:hypothetical protein [Bacteroidota bacterium]MBS1974983.1 hypothetical protein [Bacteroidota bacterium]